MILPLNHSLNLHSLSLHCKVITLLFKWSQNLGWALCYFWYKLCELLSELSKIRASHVIFEVICEQPVTVHLHHAYLVFNITELVIHCSMPSFSVNHNSNPPLQSSQSGILYFSQLLFWFVLVIVFKTSPLQTWHLALINKATVLIFEPKTLLLNYPLFSNYSLVIFTFLEWNYT